MTMLGGAEGCEEEHPADQAAAPAAVPPVEPARRGGGWHNVLLVLLGGLLGLALALWRRRRAA